MSSYSTDTVCRGGVSYSNRTYIIRLNENEIGRDNNIQDTEALLVKKNGSCDLNNINIRAQNGKTYTKLKDYLEDYGVYPKHSYWSFVEVCVGTTWVPGSNFYTNTQPSTDAPEVPFGELSPTLPRGGWPYTLSSYMIRYAFSKTPIEAMMKITPDFDTEIVENGYTHPSLEAWLYALVMDEEYKTYSPWSLIDVLVGDEWVAGTSFHSLRYPGEDGPVLRQNADIGPLLEDDEEVEGEQILPAH